MGSRRQFLQQSILAGAAFSVPAFDLLGYMHPESQIPDAPKISLAQWSLHRSLRKGELKAEEFPLIAKALFGIQAVEYVNEFYTAELENQAFWQQLRRRAESEGVKNLLMMVDEAGELGALEKKARDQAIDHHRKWMEAAKILGCHSIRVNAFGKGSREELKQSLVDGLGRLAEAGGELGMHVLIENHGLHTSDAAFMVGVIREIDSSNLGTLPDFGNWCLNKEWGSTKGGACTQSYDPVRGLEEMLPLANGVSAKSYDFDGDGNETQLPYKDLLRLVKDAGFQGYIGIEYEGDRLSEAEGVRATKALIEKTWKGLE